MNKNDDLDKFVQDPWRTLDDMIILLGPTSPIP